jgi:chromosome segregation ATPase
MNTPTPRTDAAWSATFDGEQMSAGQTARALRECSQQLETELATLTAERDQLRAEFEKIAVIAAQTQDRNVSLRIERKQLCDEAERTDVIYQRACEVEQELRAQLHALQLVCGTNDANKFETWVDRANARAERAEAAETVALAHWNKELERAMKSEAELERLRSDRDCIANQLSRIANELEQQGARK